VKDDPEHYTIRAVSAPQMRSDGKAIELVLTADDDTVLNVTLLTTDLLTIVNVIVRAYQVARNRGTLFSEVSEPPQDFEPTPQLYVATRTGSLSQPSDDIAYVVVGTQEGPELHIRFDWPQLRSMVVGIQRIDNIQSGDLDNTLPS
jgi:hypothetical protein